MKIEQEVYIIIIVTTTSMKTITKIRFSAIILVIALATSMALFTVDAKKKRTKDDDKHQKDKKQKDQKHQKDKKGKDKESEIITIVLPTLYYGDGPYQCIIDMDRSDYPIIVFQTICKTIPGDLIFPLPPKPYPVPPPPPENPMVPLPDYPVITLPSYPFPAVTFE